MQSNNERDVVILSACRTPIGRIRGQLSSIRPDDMLALVLREAVKRAKIDDAVIDEVYAGCANQAGEDNRNIARMALLLAGLPTSLPAVTVNRLCASGLEAIVQASRMIRTGDAEVCLAGGVESMSRAPWAMAKPDGAFPTGAPAVFDTSLGWRFPNSKMASIFPLEQMGETAENVAEKYQISRTDQDQFAVASHQKAVAAQKAGYFDAEIVSVALEQKKGPPVLVHQDEGPRADSSMDALAKLKPAFRTGGSVTAGNSSTLNDGASALILASRAFATAHGLPILATVRASASAGVDPRFMGIGPVPATEKLLQRHNLTSSDLDLVELNEAFAAQSLAVLRSLRIDEEKANVHGGAIALGHPLGCSGARIVTTLLGAMRTHPQARLGLTSLCVGVGQGLSVLIERGDGL